MGIGPKCTIVHDRPGAAAKACQVYAAVIFAILSTHAAAGQMALGMDDSDGEDGGEGSEAGDEAEQPAPVSRGRAA